MNNKEKEQKVKKFLLTPIQVDKHVEKIIWDGNSIITSQRFKNNPDPDMSDVAVQYYNIMYDGLNILDKEGSLENDQFAGDTMCSFNTTANLVAGKSKHQRKPYSKWPEWLQDYYNTYHCIANFWVLPKDVGRSSGSFSKSSKSKDYMDRFLLLLFHDYDDFKKEYQHYAKHFPTFTEFYQKHFLVESFIQQDEKIHEYSKEKPETIVGEMTQLIKARAAAIAKSNKCEELYELCIKYELCL